MPGTPDKTTGSLWIESPDVRTGPVARVAMLAAVDKEYSFAIPDVLAGRVEPGKRVVVPFGRKGTPQPGFCVAIAREPWTSTLKACIEVLDDERLLLDHLLELGRWISRYYCCPLGRALLAMVPEAIRRQSGFRTVRVLRLPASPPDAGQATKSVKRRAVIEALKSEPAGLELEALIERSGSSKGVIAAMLKAGLLEMDTHREPMPAPDFDQPGSEPEFELEPGQTAAIERIDALARDGAFRAVLLFGVSGSGKTEVYIRAIRQVVAAGRQAILLVPEIALTTQLVSRLASRFQDVAVVHSGLTGAQRSLTWSAIARGDKRVVIGTRSAVFAPCPALGLIIVDEEQEGSYKNQQSPRFHTRDVAVKRAQMLSIPVVLGSATPSLETWHNCQRLPHFERLDLPRRIAGLPMPAVEFVDLNLERRQRKGIHLLSQRMEQCLAETLAKGEQAVLLLNRRGYASYLVCSRCHTAIVCPNCRLNMVFHQTTGKAVCHYCNARMLMPKRCGDPGCAGTLIRFGMGTQRVEEELHTKFPQARVARADSDVLTKVAHYEQVVQAFQAGQLDILIGTQIVAKGLDFPRVSFVGVINSDTSLSAPDFRAAERTFQLVTQVAGRAGRARSGGRVVVQTLSGGSAALQFASGHQYEPFAQYELTIRRKLAWPPFARLARIVISRNLESKARQAAHELAEAIRDAISRHGLRADVLGPQTAPLSRLRNQYRYDLLVRTVDASKLMEMIDRLRNEKVLPLAAKGTIVDVDPVSLL